MSQVNVNPPLQIVVQCQQHYSPFKINYTCSCYSCCILTISYCRFVPQTRHYNVHVFFSLRQVLLMTSIRSEWCAVSSLLPVS